MTVAVEVLETPVYVEKQSVLAEISNNGNTLVFFDFIDIMIELNHIVLLFQNFFIPLLI